MPNRSDIIPHPDFARFTRKLDTLVLTLEVARMAPISPADLETQVIAEAAIERLLDSPLRFVRA